MTHRPGPPHYTYSAIEPIDAIEAWQLDYHLGNVVKYVARHAHKGDALGDLRKALWYLERAIERRAGQELAATRSAHSPVTDHQAAP